VGAAAGVQKPVQAVKLVTPVVELQVDRLQVRPVGGGAHVSPLTVSQSLHRSTEGMEMSL